MASPASIQKIHLMLIPTPIPLWIFSLVCDVIYVMGWGGAIWNDMAFYTIAGGLLGVLAAVIPGYLDYRSLTNPAVKTVGPWHMLINLSIVVLFAINLWLRMRSEPGAARPIILSAIAIAMLGVSGWLGGGLVYVHGAAVESQAKGSIEMKGRGRVA